MSDDVVVDHRGAATLPALLTLQFQPGAMKRALAVAVLAAVLVAGCTSGQTADQGRFELLVSDRPASIDDFSAFVVAIDEARVFRATGDAANATGGDTNTTDGPDDDESYTTIPVDNRSVDLTTVTGAAAASLVNASLPAGNYTKIELAVADVDATVNGSTVPVKVPSGKLMITKPFTISPNSTTRFVFDIHVVLTGTGRYILRPVIAKSGVVGKDVGRPEPPRQGPPAGRGR
ncbi:MAG: DUF4382 domain-containing protein [Candidatus Nanohaloarchaea archaeon]